MVHIGSNLTVADNSGAKNLKLIGIPGSSNKKRATVGDVVTLVVNGAVGVGTLKDHTVVQGVIVRTSKEVRRKDGSYIRFDDNAAVVINKERLMVGTRVFGPIAREIRDRGFLKIASLAKEVW